MKLKCLATDLNKDKLSYNWQCSSGTLEALGDSAIWTAPLFEGTYFVTCTVSDEYGASSVESKKIVVTPQYAYNICKTKNEGNVAITSPPRAVEKSAIPINFPGGNLSAIKPPPKYENKAIVPYIENKLPNCKLVKLNTSKNVGLNTLAKT